MNSLRENIVQIAEEITSSSGFFLIDIVLRGTERNRVIEVFIDGEGFFEVFSNPQKPFIVHANHAIIKVLGTKFNIRAWQQNKKIS